MAKRRNVPDEPITLMRALLAEIGRGSEGRGDEVWLTQLSSVAVPLFGERTVRLLLEDAEKTARKRISDCRSCAKNIGEVTRILDDFAVPAQDGDDDD